ncbi:MAG TPA: ribose-phosphate pyrophosphokinase [Gaiellaceae bacterium]|nr:ribose-phosphate pyrophosphokinase [Gaiellaceae bacterium]
METTTDAPTLPGLEVAQTVTHEQSGHFREHSSHKRLMVFAGRSHPELAQKIAEKLGLELGEITLKTFANGESYCRFEESIRGADLFLVQTGSDPVDRHLMELLMMIQAAKLASAKRVTVVFPWFSYSRQDKKSAPREPITGKLVADLLETAGADRVLTMDLHAGQIQGFFNIPVDHMTALPLFAQYFRETRGLHGDGIVSVSPDPGRAKMAVKFGQMLEADFAILHKTRPTHDVATVTEVTGPVRDKVALMGDDIISTGGTLIAGARALREAGAKEVHLFATHGLFAKDSLQRLGEAEEVDSITVTDTVPIDPIHRPEKVTVLSVSGLLAETIWNVFSDESVSAIFAGENQLF